MNSNFEIVRKLNLKITKMPNINGEMMAKCPLHADKNPSLSINIHTGKFQCFAGCIKGHSIRDLVFKITGEIINEGDELNWAQAFKHKLAFPKVGNGTRLPSIPILPRAVGNAGEEYLKSRKFTQETIVDWNIQYWEEQKAIVIPIYKIGYIMRCLEGIKKYRYVFGTNKSNALFGIEKFKTNNCSAILVEGSLDTIYMHQLGFTNTLAILGTDLSDAQLNLLRGICKQVYLLFDGDEGGKRATKEIRDKLKLEFMVKTCKLPAGKDPNDCSKTEIKESLNVFLI